MFEMEGLGISRKEEVDDENIHSYQLLRYNGKTVSAPFPLEANVIDLANNYNMAFRRLVAQAKHLAQFLEKRAWYVQTIEQYLADNVIEKVTEPPTCRNVTHHSQTKSYRYFTGTMFYEALFSAIGMNLRAFVSNCPEVNDQVKKEDRAPYEQMKLLRVDYDPITDTYSTYPA
ncbi:hypothetical protein OSTOST_00529 [Ostertagia ostertagi]